MRTLSSITLAVLFLGLTGCTGNASKPRFDAALLSFEPGRSDFAHFALGSGDALGMWKQGVPRLALSDIHGRQQIDQLARDAAARVLEDLYAVEPMTARDLREALHPGATP
ncbi:hypothetical protein [Mucisphaera calidilacus]|uniref:Uncharacterized protein n=1 Tax=Mucisphaera calidilacus TaxID=2527982 RepID=A0A518BZB7_9BACT|nr:hypothetical protein [Mucisphaera calidilacus]QDU72309.1 hypothetical protein Pan265_21730 [Mucisphaera calidilacus]